MATNAKDSIYVGSPFAAIPTQMLADPSLSDKAIRLYGVLKTYSNNDGWGAFPGRERLAERMGCSVASVKRAIAELEHAHWLFVERSRNEGGNWTSNRYVIPMEKGVKPKRVKL